MIKLFKYEWRKQMFSKLIIGAVLVLLVLLYIGGMALDKDGWQEAALALLFLAGIFAAMYVGIESLLVLDRDLKTKESHMLFMVPKSAYQILGAKILAAICQILLTGLMFAAAFFACFTAYVAANEGLAEMFRYLQQFISVYTEVEIEWNMVGLLLVAVFVGWISVIAAGYLAIIAVRTVLSNMKLAGLIAFAAFLFLNWGRSRIAQWINELAVDDGTELLYFGISLGVSALISLAFLLVSGWMAERKLSV